MITINKNSLVNIKSIKIWSSLGALLCMLSVLIGAFAAHSLKAKLSDHQLGIVDTAAQYQMYHGFAILIVSTLLVVMCASPKKIHIVNSLFALGCLLFSGSLYGLVITNIKGFAYITPLGGLCFIAGWCMLIWVICTCPNQLKSSR